MKIGRKPSTIKLTVDGEIQQQVEEFKYLGSILSSSGYTEKDIRVSKLQLRCSKSQNAD